MSLINSINKSVNYESFYGQYISGRKIKIGNQEISSQCPFHHDDNPSFSFNTETGLWHCHANCGSGNIFTFIQKAEKLSKEEATKFIIKKLNITTYNKEKSNIIDESVYMEYHKNLLSDEKALSWLQNKRGLKLEIVKKYKLGLYKKSITIPIFDESKTCKNIRFYNPKNSRMKFKSFKSGYGKARLYPIENISENIIIICEGEMDCLLLNQLGFNAITVTSGAGIWKSYWSQLFEDKTIYVCYDIDTKGKQGAKKICDHLYEYTKNLYNISLPISEPLNGDITDYFIFHKKTVTDFKQVIQETDQYKPKISQEKNIKYIPINLAEASHSENYFKHFEMKVLIVGKDLSPYIVPQAIDFKCDMGFDENKCAFCPLGFAGGKKLIEFDLNSSQLLEMIQISKNQLDLFIKKFSGIISSCNRYKATVQSAINIEEIRIIPDIDYISDEQKYVVRQAYYLGHGIESNKVYIIRGITLPEPRTQYATHMIREIEKAQDSIDTFRMNPELKEKLRIFQPII